jgi:ABC-type transport system involved in cytochrome c biogenesis permease subunit
MIEVILAFSFSILSFLIVYGLLNKIRIFERSINTIISAIVALFVLFTFYYYTSQFLVLFSLLSLFIFILFTILSIYFFKTK